jgi:hypothetical protein
LLIIIIEQASLALAASLYDGGALLGILCAPDDDNNNETAQIYTLCGDEILIKRGEALFC